VKSLLRIIALFLLRVVLAAALARGDTLSYKPIPAYSPETQAQREAAAAKQEGNRLYESGHPKDAREKWLAAIDAYRRAGYKPGESETLIQIGASYQPELLTDPEVLAPMLDSMVQGAVVAAEYLDGLAQKIEPMDRRPFAEGDALLERASTLLQAGDSMGALPLYEQAEKSYQTFGSPSGELRSLMGRLRCHSKSRDPLSFMSTMALFTEFQRVGKELNGKVTAGAIVRYLRAVEDSELGEWTQAESLLRGVVQEFEKNGDRLASGRATLDLGVVLAQTGRQAEAEALYKKADELFSRIGGPDSEQNRLVTQLNLASLKSPARSLDAVVATQQTPLAERPLPALTMPLAPEARARREAAFLMGDGDRLQRAGRLNEAREKWKAAAEAYERGGQASGMSRAFHRLGSSYTLISTTSTLGDFAEYLVKALLADLEVYESYLPKDLSRDAAAFSQVDVLLSKASRLVVSGDCKRALPFLSDAGRLYQSADYRIGEIRSSLLRAQCLARSDDNLGAFSAMFEVITKAQSLPETVPGEELATKAGSLFQEGRWREAREVYQDLLCRYESQKNVDGIARTLVDLALAQRAEGNPFEAEACLQRALGLLPFIDEKRGAEREANARENLGQILLGEGRMEEGLEEFRKARKIWQLIGQPESEALSLNRLAMGFLDNGDYGSALAALEEAEDLCRHLPSDSDLEADLLTSKSYIDLQQGQLQDALGGLYKAQHLYRERRVSDKIMITTEAIFGLQGLLGRYDLEDSEKSGRERDSGLPARFAELQALWILFQNDKLQGVVEMGRKILPFWIESGNSTSEAMVRCLLGLSYFRMGKYDEAHAEVEALAQISQKVEPWVEGMVMMVTSLDDLMRESTVIEAQEGLSTDQERVRALKKKFGRSLQEQLNGYKSSTDKAFLSSDLTARNMALVERLMAQDPEGSLREIGATISIIDQWSRGLTLSELKAPFLDHMFGFYSMGVEVGAWANKPEEAFSYAEKARARAFVDQIGNQRIEAGRGADPDLVREERRLRLQRISRQKSLDTERKKDLAEENPALLSDLQRSLERVEEDYQALIVRLKATNPEYASLVGIDTLSLGEIQRQALDAGTTLVEYFIPDSLYSSNSRIFAWVIDRERFSMTLLPVTSDDIRKRVTELRNLIEARKSVGLQLGELYRDLFLPLLPKIRYRNLVIVPHGVLHFFPFAALWDEKGRRYLGDGYTLSYAPSATALKFARDRKAVPRAPLLAVGDPDGSLPHAATEATTVAHLYGGEPLLGPAATEGEVVAQAGGAGILHIAAHAVLNPVNPLFTRIELAPDKDHDGRLEVNEIFGLDLSRTGLVVLSACRTQVGNLSAGDELQGLARAFLFAGTPAVVASLWSVEDESSSFLMQRFYTHLRAGEGRAEALRQAQGEARGRFPHPRDWAAFVLTGDGR